MKFRNLAVAAVIGVIVAVSTQAAGAAEPHVGVSAAEVSKVIKKLGLKAEQFKDAKGNPHFVLKGKFDGEKDVAIFMEDCKAGRCVDVTFYADFGAVPKMTAATLNEWNHIDSKLRSKAFRSDGIDNKNGPVGISSTVSYLDSHSSHALGMQLGLFLVEVKMFGATIQKL
jgi:hypothetical protein